MTIQKPLCFVDLETTGTDIQTARIVEISVLKIFPEGGEVINKALRVNPIFPIPKEASDVHGITDDMVKDCPTFKQIARGLMDFLEGSDLAGFNSTRYDFPLLLNEFARAGLNWNYAGCRFIDVGNLFKIKEERTLSAAVKFYLGRDHDGAHGAAADVQATKEIFFKMFDLYEDLPKDPEELQLFSNFGKPLLDLSGNFTVNETGQIIFSFGKHKGKVAATEKGYLQWMLKSDFQEDTKAICRSILFT